MKNKVLIGCGTIVGGFFALLIITLVGIGSAIDMGYMADSAAQPKGKVHPRYIEKLREMKVIGAEEEVHFFYSGALYSISSQGDLFTNERVVSYRSYDDTLELSSAKYAEIESIIFKDAEEWSGDSLIEITKKDGDWFTLSVGTGSDMDDLFYKKLKSTWELKSPRVDEIEDVKADLKGE